MTILLLGHAAAQDNPSAAQEQPAEQPNILLIHPDLPPADNTASALREILADPKYLDERYVAPQGETWLEKFIKWLAEMLSRIGIPANNDLSVLAVVAIIVLLIAVIVRMLWGMLGKRGFAASDKPAEVDERELTSAGLRKLAVEAAERGNLRAALRYRFLAVVSDAQLPYSSLMTNTQIRRLINRVHPEADHPFGELVLAFENAWYGGHELSPVAYQSAVNLAQDIESKLGDQE